MDKVADAGSGLAAGDAEVFRLIFQGKWRLPILREIVAGPRRLSTLRRSIPQATKKMLVDTLHSLERLGWIVRTEHDGTVRRVEYAMADAYSEKIGAILNSIPHL